MRRAASRVIRGVAHWTGFSRRRAQACRNPRILAIHAVGVDRYPADMFRAQMEFLREHFRVVPVSEVARRLASGDGHEDGAVCLTFDDGLRSHAAVAYPILKELGLPATFYICPGLIDRGSWLWNQELRARLLSRPPARRCALLRSLGSPSENVEESLAWMKTLSADQLQPIIDAIVSETRAFVPTPAQSRAHDLMSWDDVRSLDPTLITIGSHTVSHTVLPPQSDEQIEFEIVQSRRLIEQKAGRPVETFNYPDGQWNGTVAALVQATYRSAVTMRCGFVDRSEGVHLLPRLPMARDLPALSWILHWPGRSASLNGSAKGVSLDVAAPGPRRRASGTADPQGWAEPDGAPPADEAERHVHSGRSRT